MSNDRLSVELGISWHSSILLGVLHGGGLAGLWVAEIPLWLRVFLSLGVAASGLYSIAAHALRCVDAAVTAINCDANENWHIVNGSGQPQPAVLLPGAYVHPLVTIMRFRRADGKRVCVTLVADGLDREDFRRLRVRLRTRWLS